MIVTLEKTLFECSSPFYDFVHFERSSIKMDGHAFMVGKHSQNYY